MIYKMYCMMCDDESQVEVETVDSRWEDKSIDDCELTTTELIARFNGDVVYTITCLECSYQWEDL
ncbi:hypothetical protein [Photobacterium sanguinicancri]|uniref:hypothetical protein n=1 Tax=Photobacterium sanguinicancri TaxID=875932 RepID=UPI0026E1AE49|nr:hypothetical protein [Photobacterium sanguinicancri]